MNLANKIASLYVAEEGRQVLQSASIECDAERPLRVEIVESEDLGLWIKVLRQRREHNFLLRWEYILGIEIELPRGRPFGLTGRKDLG